MERPFEIAQHAIAIGALRDPGFGQLRLEIHCRIGSHLHRVSGVRLCVHAVEEKKTSDYTEPRPGVRKFWIELNRHRILRRSFLKGGITVALVFDR